MYLSLTHSEESVRVIASEKLKLELSKGGEEVDVQPFEDKEMLSQILSDRLADSSVRVANVILSIPNLHYHVKPVALVQTLVSILWKRVKDSAANVGLNKDLPAQEIKLMCRVLDTLVHTVINFKSDMAEPMISAANEVFFASLFICKELKQVNVKAIQLLSLEALPFHLPSNVVKLQQQSAAAATSDEHSATIELANLIVDGFAESCIGGHLSDGASPVLAAVMDMLKSNIIPARLLATLVLIRVLQSKPSISIAQALIDYAVNEIQILKQQQGTTAATSCSPDALIKQLVTGFKCLDTKSQILFLSSCCISFIQVVVSTLKKPEVFGKENLWMRHEDSLTSEQISEAGAYRKLMVSLYKMLMKGVGRFAEFSDMIKVLFANHLEKDALQFLSGVFTDSWGEFDSDVVEASLMVATAYIANISAHSKKMVDFQLFIPTLLVTLQHEKQSVRTEAINCLESVCASLSKTQIVTKSKKSNTDIFAYDSFYGSGSENLQYLTADITLKFTSTLVEFKSELIADPGYLSRALVSIIGAHVEDDSSEWQSTVLVFLCSNILAFPSVAPRIALLKAISLISSPIKITIMFPMLDVKNEIANNSQVLSLMLQCFDLQSTDSIFEAGGSSKKYYRLFSKLLKGSSLLASKSNKT